MIRSLKKISIFTFAFCFKLEYCLFDFIQDSIDLFLGNYTVEEAYSSSPLQVQKDWKFLALPIIMVVAFSMCIICLLMAGDTWTETLAYVIFWAVASIGTATIILYNGKDFVDAPKLVQKEKMD
ncbi:hypothetical protein AB205_0051400 [Aquarana catesbeiana]|uniref:Uncharacterized protein n=1 Tax=Aquarana catesbeiana TaxID=8400 RepID=A0A2G9RFX8_AQUCT|nr:hypothetical protein AB205_0051400 [Aquarana catesbeiana]